MTTAKKGYSGKLHRAVAACAFLIVCSTLTALSGPRLEIFRHDDRVVVLTVLVTDGNGRPISGANVNVYIGSFWLGTDSYVRPPSYRGQTRLNGIAPIEMKVNAGERLRFTIEVSREDMDSERRELDLGTNFPSRLPLERFKLIPRTTTTEYPTTSIRVVVADGESSSPLEGALIKLDSTALPPSVRSRPHVGYTGPDGAATVAIELMSADSVESIGITVSKNGYRQSSHTMPVAQGNAIGKTIDYPGTIILRKTATPMIEVKITVLDTETNNGVREADVILDGPEYKTTTTDMAGVATIFLETPGTYVVRLSQDNYYPVQDKEIRVLKTGAAPDPIRLQRKPSKDAANDTIDITVLAREYAGTKDPPRPLKNASVSDGRQTTVTDATGKATLRGAYDLSHSVTVSAENYQSATQMVPVRRAFMGKATGRAIFTLQPALNDNTPLRFIIRVLDDVGKPVPGIEVEFVHQGRTIHGALTNAAGERDLRSSDVPGIPVSDLRKGITLNVKRGSEFVILNRQVPSNLLQPSLDAGRYDVTIPRDWSGLRRSIEALEPRVAAWKNSVSSDPSGKTLGFIETADKLVFEAEALEKEFRAALAGIETPEPGKSPCEQARVFLSSITSKLSPAHEKARLIRQRLDEAMARTKTCATANEAELIRAGERDAIRMLAELGSINKEVVRDRGELMNLAVKTAPIQNVVSELKPKLIKLRELATKADANFQEATNTYANDADRSRYIRTNQATLITELAVLSVKAKEGAGAPADLTGRISDMEKILASVKNRPGLGTRQIAPMPQSIREAGGKIDAMHVRSGTIVAALDRSFCKIDTLEDAVTQINTAFENSVFEVGLAADLPRLADACADKAKAGIGGQVDLDWRPNGTSGTQGNGSGDSHKCDANEAAVFAKMAGTWRTVMGAKIVIGGSCDNVTGTEFYTDYCENPDAEYNKSLARHQAPFTGSIRGTALRLTWSNPQRKGSGDCYIGNDGKLRCSGLPCHVNGTKSP